MPVIRRVAFWVGLLLAGACFVIGRTAWGLEPAAAATAAVTVLCAVWWCSEAVPIPVTSIVPFAFFPLLGVLDHGDLAAAFGDKFVLLFMAGFMLSRAAEKSQTHLRVAHGIMRVVGTTSGRRIIIGFMLATAFLSMWISNTATALIMLPVALAVLQEHRDARFGVSLLLGIAYGASIGGIATIIGTPPNGVFVSIYEDQVGRNVDFLTWLKIGVPVSLLMLLAAAVVLTARVKRIENFRLIELGAWTPAQRRVLAVMTATALLWIFRKAPFGGWSSLPLFAGADIQDATVGFLGVLAMFVIPSGERDDTGGRATLLDWKTARDIPWGILLLFAGGICIAKAFAASGLDQSIGQALTSVSALHPLLVIALLCLAVTFMTEVTSNTATTTLLMPILSAAGLASGLDPAVYMIPAALSASCAFMLPVATPPNAIVFAADAITIPKMARVGVVLNLIGVAVISLCCYYLIDPQTGIDGVEPPAATSSPESSRLTRPVDLGQAPPPFDHSTVSTAAASPSS